jgi:hypothetical protein
MYISVGGVFGLGVCVGVIGTAISIVVAAVIYNIKH